jgi:2,3-bisphosphoglycerate-independent phosphoglycerate mutase
MIAPTAIIKGLGQSLDMYTPDVEGATGDYNSNYKNKMDAAIALFKDNQKSNIIPLIYI